MQMTYLLLLAVVGVSDYSMFAPNLRT